MPKWFFRTEQAESSRLAWAFAISLAFHLVIFGGYHAGKKFQVWENLHWPSWLRPVQTLVEMFKKKEDPKVLALQKQQQKEPPLMFIDVNPAQETAEPPKDAKFYSAHNSKAANPDTKVDTGIPQISGSQAQVPKTQETPRKVFEPLQPAPPPPTPAPQAKEPQEAAKPKPAFAPGDLTLAKPTPTPTPNKEPGEAPKPKPRTVREARMRKQADSIAGQAMKQDGGVKRYLELSSVDAKATPFGAYDAALIAAVQARWYSLLEQREYAFDAHGKVVLQFSLHYDGRITDMNVADSSVNEVLSLICQKAVLDPAPFAAWPTEMRRMMGEVRNIQFTFYYN